jgi:hypothetical protein
LGKIPVFIKKGTLGPPSGKIWHLLGTSRGPTIFFSQNPLIRLKVLNTTELKIFYHESLICGAKIKKTREKRKFWVKTPLTGQLPSPEALKRAY